MNAGQHFEPVEISEELFEVVKPELAPGERLVWAGSGTPSRDFHRLAGSLVWIAGLSLSSMIFLGAGAVSAQAHWAYNGISIVLGMFLGLLALIVTTGSWLVWPATG